MRTNLTEALALADRGYRVFPLYGFAPAFKGWQDAATFDKATIQSWFEPGGPYESHNVAVATGRGLLVADADCKNGKPGLSSLELMDMMGADLGFLVETKSGGRHAYFKVTDGQPVPNSVDKLAGYPGIDIRGDGGYVVAPGTPGYEILTSRPTPEAPSWLTEVARGAKRIRDAAHAGETLVDQDSEFSIQSAIAYLKDNAPEAIEGAGGNDTTYRVLSWLKDLGLSQDRAVEIADVHWNQAGKASPPWDIEELERIAENAYAYGTAAIGKRSAEAEFEAVELIDRRGQSATEPAAKRPLQAQPINLDDLADIPPREWLYGYKMSRKYVTFIASPGGTGKTALIFAMALAAASAKPLLHDTPRKPLRAWIYNLEDDMLELRRRLKAALTHYDLPPETLHNLRMNSGRDRRFQIVKLGQTGNFVIQPDYKAIIEELKREAIDILFVDPFLRSHGVPENENEAQDEVMRLYAQIAEEANCAIVLVHHTKKGAVAGEMDSMRGASTQGGGARAAFTLSAMSVDEAAKVGVPEHQRRLYVRIDDAKNNMAPPAAKAEWLKLESVPLGNVTDDYPAGDHVQVATPWEAPAAMDGMTGEECDEALAHIGRGMPDGERYSIRPQDKDRYAGLMLEEHFMRTPQQAKMMLDAWVSGGVLEVREYRSETQRKSRKGLFLATE